LRSAWPLKAGAVRPISCAPLVPRPKVDGGLGMARLFALKPHWTLALFVSLDTLCVGMGMGVPIFCIVSGLVVGWYAVRRLALARADLQRILGRVFLYAVITSAHTFAVMSASRFSVVRACREGHWAREAPDFSSTHSRVRTAYSAPLDSAIRLTVSTRGTGSCAHGPQTRIGAQDGKLGTLCDNPCEMRG